MQDRVPLYPGRVTLTPVSGQANTYDLTRADQPTQEGTPLNKASLLKDETAALFGLGTSAVPDDVLSKIKTLINSANANANTKARIATGSYTGTGTYGSSHPNSLTFEFEPKLVFISSKDQDPPMCAFAINGQTTFSKTNIGDSGQTNQCYFSGNSFTWYNIRYVDTQFNMLDRIYYYVAIG